MRAQAIIGVLLVALSGGPSLWTSSKQTQRCGTKSGRIVSTVVPSASYGKPVAVNVYLPPCYAADGSSLLPVIYLLHGGSGDEPQWPDLNVRISADALIARGAPPFVVIMPGATYYEGIDYSMFVMKELLPGIESHYRVQTSRSERAIGGLSLGGYWALKIAFLHPDLFDFLGFGFSDKPRLHDYSLFEQADIAQAVAAHFGLKRTFILTHDMGNSVALEILKRGDPVVDKLVMLNGSMLLKYYRSLLSQKLLLHHIFGPVISALRLIHHPVFARQFRSLFATQPSELEIDK